MSPAPSPAAQADDQPIHRLILFVCDHEPNSARARENLDRLRAAHLPERCEVQVIDVLDDYRTALEHQVLVTPCLVKVEPAPRALIAGTLHDTDTVLTALQLPGGERS